MADPDLPLGVAELRGRVVGAQRLPGEHEPVVHTREERRLKRRLLAGPHLSLDRPKGGGELGLPIEPAPPRLRSGQADHDRPVESTLARFRGGVRSNAEVFGQDRLAFDRRHSARGVRCLGPGRRGRRAAQHRPEDDQG